MLLTVDECYRRNALRPATATITHASQPGSDVTRACAALRGGSSVVQTCDFFDFFSWKKPFTNGRHRPVTEGREVNEPQTCSNGFFRGMADQKCLPG